MFPVSREVSFFPSWDDMERFDEENTDRTQYSHRHIRRKYCDSQQDIKRNFLNNNRQKRYRNIGILFETQMTKLQISNYENRKSPYQDLKCNNIKISLFNRPLKKYQHDKTSPDENIVLQGSFPINK